MNRDMRNGHAKYNTNKSAQIVRDGQGLVFDLGGPIIELLRGSEEDAAYCVIKGTLRPGASIFLHSHSDPESFYVLSGDAEVLTETPDGFAWRQVGQGDFADIPADMKHAWRNPHTVALEVVVSTTPRLGGFLRELGALIRNEGIRPESIRNLEERYGYWSGTPEENARVGITIPSWQAVTHSGPRA